MRVGADERVGIGDQLAVDLGGEDDAGEVFEIDLVADAHAGRHGGEVAEGRLAPLEEGVALAVALELEQRVGLVGRGGAELVDLHGVVDDQLGGRERVDALGIAAEGLDGVAHGGEIDDGGDAGEVLHEDAGGHVGDFAAGLGFGVPVGEELDVGGGDVDAVFAAQQVFKQDLEAEGKAAEIEAARGERGKAIDGVGAVAGVEHGRLAKLFIGKDTFLSACERAEFGCKLALAGIAAVQNSCGPVGTRDGLREQKLRRKSDYSSGEG